MGSPNFVSIFIRSKNRTMITVWGLPVWSSPVDHQTNEVSVKSWKLLWKTTLSKKMTSKWWCSLCIFTRLILGFISHNKEDLIKRNLQKDTTVFVGYLFSWFSWVGQTTKVDSQQNGEFHWCVYWNLKTMNSRIHELVFLLLTTKIGIHELKFFHSISLCPSMVGKTKNSLV